MHTHPNHPENQKARMRQSPGFRQGKEPITRGVWIAPWEGPNGEIILMAITREVRLVGTPLTVPLFADAAPYIESLWNQLDEADPLTRAPNPGTRPKLTIVR